MLLKIWKKMLIPDILENTATFSDFVGKLEKIFRMFSKFTLNFNSYRTNLIFVLFNTLVEHITIFKKCF